MIRLTRCHRPDHVKEYFQLHLAPGDSQSNPIASPITLRSFWTGPALSDVSLSAHTLPAASELVRLGRGLHPSKKIRLAPSVNRCRAYYDLTVCPPKTISLAALLEPGHPTAGSIAFAHVEAMKEVGKALENMILPRSGTGPGKWVGAFFHHTHTREGDPHLHSHLVLPNLAKNKEGKWRAMEVVIAGQNRTQLELVYAIHLTRSLRDMGLGKDLVMRKNGMPELRPLLKLVPRYSKATRAVLKAAKTADAAHPEHAAQESRFAGEIHRRTQMPIRADRRALQRRAHLADQIRKQKPKDADDPVKLSEEARQWRKALDNQEHRALVRLLDEGDQTNPRRPIRILRTLPPSAAEIVREAYGRIAIDQKATSALLLRASVAESAGQHTYDELQRECEASLERRQKARKRIRAMIEADSYANAVAASQARSGAMARAEDAAARPEAAEPAATVASQAAETPAPTRGRGGRRR